MPKKAKAIEAVTDDQIRQMRQLREDGLSLLQVAERLQLSKSTVGKHTADIAADPERPPSLPLEERIVQTVDVLRRGLVALAQGIADQGVDLSPLKVSDKFVRIVRSLVQRRDVGTARNIEGDPIAMKALLQEALQETFNEFWPGFAYELTLRLREGCIVGGVLEWGKPGEEALFTVTMGR